MRSAVKASPKHPVLIDKYLSDAIEVDADAISDGMNVVVAGIMEHIEEAGVHSGDSACSLPPYSLDAEMVEEIRATNEGVGAGAWRDRPDECTICRQRPHDLCAGSQSARFAHGAVRQ